MKIKDLISKMKDRTEIFIYSETVSCLMPPDGDCEEGRKQDALDRAEGLIFNLPSVQPEPFVDTDKLKRCRFEYINACKTVKYQTPDTRKNDIYDAYAVIKALYPIFGDEEF